uniref:Odorant binding preotein n=1 Tax=Conogethes punctiferalis TaxID=1133088 RepID=A0A2H4FYL0_CONPF|nr:odorant binding preotein [Conogethes punctiferalis]
MSRVVSVTLLALLALSVGLSVGASTGTSGSSATTSGTTSNDRSTDDVKGKLITPADDQGNMTSSEERALDVPDLMAVMVECNDSFRIEMGYLESLNESGSFPDEIDRTPKCYVRCVLEKTGVASEDGLFDPAQAAAVFAGERNGVLMTNLEDLATRCAADRNEKCKCERSYNFIKCLMEAEIKEYVSN